MAIALVFRAIGFRMESFMTKAATHLNIGGRLIGPGQPPYVIAEMSANHNGQLSNAFKIIEEAKRCGADAVKLQTYTPDTITLNSNSDEFKINGGLWDGLTLYELYTQAHMPWDWHKPLFDHARQTGITIFSSPFDSTAVDLLEDLNAPAYKIASFEAIDLPLIQYVASTGKPMIISTGMADADEIQDAVDTALSSGCSQLALLYCVSGYPAPAKDYKLKTMQDMATRFGCVTGLSDHTIDNTTAITSIALGSSLIEKHFTLDRNGGGPDDSFSLESKELKSLCDSVLTAWNCLGDVDYGRQSSEKANVQFRRSLYFVEDLKAGQIITADSVRSVRPGYGIAPKYMREILGKRVICDVSKFTPVKFELINY